jgi:hypothetical protein
MDLFIAMFPTVAVLTVAVVLLTVWCFDGQELMEPFRV